MSPTETFPDYSTFIDSAFRCGSVRVVGAKKPEDSLLCACDTEELTDGERLRVLRLRAGLTIRQAAELVGICRHTLMNYESGRTMVKSEVSDRLMRMVQVTTNMPTSWKAVKNICDMSEHTKNRETARLCQKALHGEAFALKQAKNE